MEELKVGVKIEAGDGSVKGLVTRELSRTYAYQNIFNRSNTDFFFFEHRSNTDYGTKYRCLQLFYFLFVPFRSGLMEGDMGKTARKNVKEYA